MGQPMGKFVRVFCTSLCVRVGVFCLFVLNLRWFHMYMVVSVDEHLHIHLVHTYMRIYVYTYIHIYIYTYMQGYLCPSHRDHVCEETSHNMCPSAAMPSHWWARERLVSVEAPVGSTPTLCPWGLTCGDSHSRMRRASKTMMLQISARPR